MYVAGVDEAGKGPWAGPVTAGAVMIQDEKQVVKSVRDSKLMTAAQRENAFDEICQKSTAFGIAIISAEEIDSIGIDYAVKKAMTMALEQIEEKNKRKLDHVIVDGSKTKPLDKFTAKRILKGGLYHYSISAGSVLAKVTRDRIMKQLAQEYPKYGFEKHVGYGTALHIKKLQEHGPCPIHRKSYAPIKKLLTSY